MNFKKFGSQKYLLSEKLDGFSSLAHCFTTREGGFSTGKIQGLNLGFRVGDNPDAVVKNYRQVCDDMGFSFDNMVLSRQEHTDNIRIVTEEDKGKGLTKESDIFETDGLITDLKNVPLGIFYADCVPVLLYDREKQVIGAVHSGWRGTVMGISAKAVEIFKEKFGSEAKDIVCAIGPCIGPCCFEVQEDVAGHFDSEYVIKKENGRFNIDLWKANVDILVSAGVPIENIDIAEECTKCKNQIYYSYRAHGKEHTGRMCAFIELKD